MSIINKKIILVFITCFLVSITACKKETVQDLNQNEIVGTGSASGASSSEEVDQWPNEINDYVDTNYAANVIDYVEKSDDGNYHVYLDDGTELIFDVMGTFVEIGTGDDLDDDGDNGDSGDSIDSGDSGDSGDSDGIELAEADVPTAILDYLATNHDGIEISSIELKNSTTIEVELADGTELYFDIEGNILEGPNTDGDDGDSEDSADDDGDDEDSTDDGDSTDGDDSDSTDDDDGTDDGGDDDDSND